MADVCYPKPCRPTSRRAVPKNSGHLDGAARSGSARQVQGAGRDEHSHVKKKARLRDEVRSILKLLGPLGA